MPSILKIIDNWSVAEKGYPDFDNFAWLDGDKGNHDFPGNSGPL